MIQKGEIPFVRFLLAYIPGILIAWYFPLRIQQIYFFLFFFLLPTVLVLGLIYYKRFHLYRFRWIGGLLFYIFLFLVSSYRTLEQSGQFQSNHFSVFKAKSLLVKIKSEPVLRADIARFEVEVINADQQEVSGKLLVALKADSSHSFNLNYGDILLIPAVYHEVEPPYNPGEFDFKYYLKTKQIKQQCFINEKQIKKIASNRGNPIISFALNLRQKIIQQFKKHMTNPEATALASTLIMGYRADLNVETLNSFSKTGTMHILSVSGMHVALVFLLLGFLLKPMDKVPRMRLLKTCILIAMIWFYALITGFSPSVNRAALMISFVILGKAISKKMNTYNLLAISAFILLLYNPFYLFDVGFQLSYLAVFGLVFLHPHIYQSLYIKNKLLDAAWSYTALSLAAQIVTFPLSVYLFHQFPLYFLLSNLLVVLPVTLLMYVGIAFVLLLPFNLLLPYIGSLLKWLVLLSNQILHYISQMPMASLDGIWISGLQLLVLCVLTIAYIFAFIYKNKTALFVAMGTTLFLLIHHRFEQFESLKREEIIFYSLRKNTALVYFRGKEYELITDLKPTDKVYQFSVKPSLERAGLHLKNWVNTNSLTKHFMQLGNYRILRWTSNFNHQKFMHPIRVDAVLLSDNPKIKLYKLRDYAHFNQLIIDATNPDYQIKRWIDEAERLGMDYHVLKKNPALVIRP